MKIRTIKILAAAVILAALTSLMPALASGSFEAVVASKSMKVYDKNEPHGALGSLSRGTRVTVLEYSGGAALISYNGKTGIAKVSDLAAIASTQASAQADEVETASASELMSAEPCVTAKATKVYRKASTSSKSMKVKAGVTVNVLAVRDGWAKVERDGTVGYMNAGHLASPEAVTEAQSKSADSVTEYDGKTVAAAEKLKIYSKPDTSSASMTVDRGTQLSLVAVKGNIAKVKVGGKTGYVDARKLTDDVGSESAATTAEIAADNTFTGSNEQIIYKFLVKKMGYNAAAACGVLSNIKHESSYNPNCNGDSGTSYGIAQWHAGRKTRLIDWCNSNGYDYTTLEGQLYFLQYELKTYYPAVHSKMKSAENTAQGAYDAAYYFCYNFEAPANRAARSNTRGNYAKDTLWERYAV